MCVYLFGLRKKKWIKLFKYFFLLNIWLFKHEILFSFVLVLVLLSSNSLRFIGSGTDVKLTINFSQNKLLEQIILTIKKCFHNLSDFHNWKLSSTKYFFFAENESNIYCCQYLRDFNEWFQAVQQWAIFMLKMDQKWD